MEEKEHLFVALINYVDINYVDIKCYAAGDNEAPGLYVAGGRSNQFSSACEMGLGKRGNTVLFFLSSQIFLGSMPSANRGTGR